MQDEIVQGDATLNADGSITVFTDAKLDALTHFTSDGDVIRLIGHGVADDVRHYGKSCVAALARSNALEVAHRSPAGTPNNDGATRVLHRRR